MKLFNTVSLVSNIAKGYALQEALRIVSSCGFGHVEIASIGGMCEHVAPSDIVPGFAQSLSDMLKRENLNVYAFSGHLDLTQEGDLAGFLKKMDLAAAIGCKIINTNSGPSGRMSEFRRNVRKVIDRAERLGITVCLESHGDIVGTAEQSVKLFREINHPLIRMNYDTGNTYFYARGDVSVENDILYALEYLAYVHIKDVSIEGGRVFYRPLGKGDIDLKKVFVSLGQLGRQIPCGLEIPVFVTGTFEGLSPAAAPISKDEICDAVSQSMSYMQQAGVI